LVVGAYSSWDGRYSPVVGGTGQNGRPGRLVLDALESGHPAAGLVGLSGSPQVVRLLRQLFLLSLRRCFAGHDVREITCYVRDLLEWLRLPARGELARQTEALIRAALGEPLLASGIPVAHRYVIICAVVGDLARPPGATPAVIAELIEQAARRVDRFDDPPPRRSRR
jgi:hypothetical protein